MSENPLDSAVSLAAADVVAARAAGTWWKAGPFMEGDRVRQLFGSGVLDGGTATLEACMNDHTDDPNVTAPDAAAIVPVADIALDDLSVSGSALVITRANWLRVVVTGPFDGAALDTKWWLK